MDPEVLAVAAAGAVAALVAGFGLRAWRRRAVPGAEQRHRDAPGSTLRDGLRATRHKLAEQLQSALGRPGGVEPEGVLAAVTDVLLAADVGLPTTTELVGRLRARLGAVSDRTTFEAAFRGELRAELAGEPIFAPSSKPWVILVTGVNGVGKTTTVGKLAALHGAAGRRVLLVAADTFRAGAIDQLAVWAERTGAEIVRQAPGASAAAVVFDGMKAACARGIDVVIVDTAGRLHTRTNLMEELAKVRRVIAREVPTAPHETLLVLDATTGQNAVAQARTFAAAVGVTGVVLTKLDGTARGGVALAVRREIGAPLRYVGVGEGAQDLRPFDVDEFVDALLEPSTP